MLHATSCVPPAHKKVLAGVASQVVLARAKRDLGEGRYPVNSHADPHGHHGQCASTAFSPFKSHFLWSQQLPRLLFTGWALAVVTSRAFRVRGPTQPAAMLPLIDMCNHSFQPNCSLKASDNGDVQLVSLQNIDSNQPLLLSYGNLSNDFLLMDYGFVVPGNPFDRVQLSFSLQLLEVRLHLWLWMSCEAV